MRLATLTKWQEVWSQQYGRQSVSSLLLEPPRNGFSPPKNASESGFRTVSISAVRRGKFSIDGCVKFANASLKKVEPFFVRKNDVFVVRGNGNRRLTGRAGLAEASIDDLFYPDLLIRLRFNPDKLEPALATALWNSPTTHTRLISRSKSTNGTWKINGKDIRVHSLRRTPS